MTLSAKGDFKTALRSVMSARWRSLLTTTGVVIGIASVVTVVSIGEGIKHQVTSQINHLGSDLITIRAGSVSSVNGASALSALSSPAQTGLLTNRDVQVVAASPGVKLAVPFSIVPGTVQIGSQKFPNGQVIATTSGVPTVLNQSLQYGDLFNDNDPTQNGAVLGQNIAQELFPGMVPLGHGFSFHGQAYIVRGVFNHFDDAPLSLNGNFNNAVFISYANARQLENNSTPIYEILAKPNNPSKTGAAVASIKSRLLAAHGGVQNFSVLKQSESLAVSNSILNLLTKLISGIAAISLIVGGMGIMDVMLVSVSERTREIGIRKSVGATNRQILNQFLTEAVILSLFGGVGGLALSLIINLGLRIFTDLQPLVVWQVMVLAAGVSLVVGVIFGIVPAIKAARKDPIDALRYQ